MPKFRKIFEENFRKKVRIFFPINYNFLSFQYFLMIFFQKNRHDLLFPKHPKTSRSVQQTTNGMRLNSSIPPQRVSQITPFIIIAVFFFMGTKVGLRLWSQIRIPEHLTYFCRMELRLYFWDIWNPQLSFKNTFN